MEKNVLVVVDGDAWVHRAIVNASARGGDAVIEVVPCTTARGGLNACCALEPDCVLIELALGDLDGLWLVDALRTQPSRVATLPIILTTPCDDDTTRIRVLRAGADVFVPKPFPMIEMVAQIRALIAMTERLREPDAARGGSILPAEEVSGAGKRAIVGDLDRMSVSTVLGALELEQRSGDLVLRGAAGSGRLVMNLAGGMLVGGWLGSTALSPLDTLRRALSWPGRRFEFRVSEERRVSSSAGRGALGALVIEALRLDEPPPEAPPLTLDLDGEFQANPTRSGMRRRSSSDLDPAADSPQPVDARVEARADAPHPGIIRPTAPGRRLVETVATGPRPDPRVELDDEPVDLARDPAQRTGSGWLDDTSAVKVRRARRR